MQNLGGQTECIMGNWKIVNENGPSFHPIDLLNLNVLFSQLGHVIILKRAVSFKCHLIPVHMDV